MNIYVIPVYEYTHLHAYVCGTHTCVYMCVYVYCLAIKIHFVLKEKLLENVKVCNLHLRDAFGRRNVKDIVTCSSACCSKIVYFNYCFR